MKFLLLLARDDQEWEALGEEGQDYGAIMRWWAELAARGLLLSGADLQPARRARTVRWRNGRPLVTDGPFIEAKESVGGFGIIDVPDMEAALAIARTWPAPGHSVEVRPLAGRSPVVSNSA